MDRLRALAPVFEQVAGETRTHPHGPIPAAFLMAIAWGESSFEPRAVGPPIAGSSARALGLMQVLDTHAGREMFAWAPELAFRPTRDQLLEPLPNVRSGASLLLTDFGFGTNIVETLRRYGGFVTADPGSYIGKVESRFAYLSALRLAGRI